MTPHLHLIQTIVDNIQEQMTFIEKAIEKLPESKFWYQFNENTNSVGILCQHLCGNLNQYIISGLGGKNDLRKRDEEFLTSKIMTKSDLLKNLKVVIENVLEIISSLESKKMINKHHIQGIEINTIEVLLHVSHHLAYHSGQIVYITKMITNEQLDLFKGRNLNLSNA